MGLLDDAIREHLELKRRAGADAMDVARQEREALGRRGLPPDLMSAPPTHADPGYGEPVGAEPDVYEDEPPAYGAGAPRPGPYDDAGPFDEDEAYEEDQYEDEPPYVAPPPPPPARPPPPPPPVYAAQPSSPPPPAPPVAPPPPPPGPPTEEYRMPPAEAPEADDVLEQTPDFLEETPEHDRLWFEQAPPREFDFDK
jgi:hypothetical protein